MRRVRTRYGHRIHRNEIESPAISIDQMIATVNATLNKLLNEYSSPTGTKIDEELIMAINRAIERALVDRFGVITTIYNNSLRRVINSLDLTSDPDGQIEEFIWNSLITVFKENQGHYSVEAKPLTGFTGLVEMCLYATPERQLKIFQRLYTLFKSDPEINPNWKLPVTYGSSKIKKFSQNILIYIPNSGQLLDLVNSCGSFDDLVYLIKRPGFAFPSEPIISGFHAALSPSQITELVEILKSKTSRGRFKMRLNTFGFRPNSHEKINWALSSVEVDALHFREPIISRHNLGPRCHGCQEITKRSEIRFKGPAFDATKTLSTGSKNPLSRGSECKCQFHVECALNLVCSYVGQILHPNPLERNIMVCPGCQGEIRPSFVSSVVNHLSQLDNLLNIIERMPKEFMKDYCREIKTLMTLTPKQINDAIFVINHQRDPKFVVCPKDGCQGFALIEPELELNTQCLVCGEKSLFIGSQRQKEIQKDSPEVIELLTNTDKIRPCTECGKLIEKSEGCNNMNCAFCGSFFNWERARHTFTNHPELVIHF